MKKSDKRRVSFYLTEKELKAAEAIAQKQGLRTVNNWIVTVVLRALILR